MRYNVENIEDQLLATLLAQSGLTSGVKLETHAGQVDRQMFFDPAYMQGLATMLPFIYLEYAGRYGKPEDHDDSHTDYIHTLRFRFYIGAQSLRSSKEAARSGYSMLRAVYDAIHGKLPYYSTAQVEAERLSGTRITTTGFYPCSPMFAGTGTDEALLVNTPTICIYMSEYQVRLHA